MAIARALVLGADLILADEPTGNLDATTAQDVLDLFERRALGAEPSDILWQIWTEGLLIGLFGGIVGAGIGAAAIAALGQWSGIPVLLDPLVLAIPCAIVLLASLAGLFPARTAARLDPAQALRPTAA